MDFDAYVTQYLRDENVYAATVQRSVLHGWLARLSSVVILGNVSMHPYRILQREPITPFQQAAVLKGVDARKERDSLERMIATEFPDAKESLKRRATDCLRELHALKYEHASDEFYKK